MDADILTIESQFAIDLAAPGVRNFASLVRALRAAGFEWDTFLGKWTHPHLPGKSGTFEEILFETGVALADLHRIRLREVELS